MTQNYSNPSDADTRQEIVYYPLFLDIAALTAKPEPEQDLPPQGLNAEEIMQLAIQHDCTEFQTLVLLIKNAFEGHVFLSFGISSGTLFEKGLLRFDPANDSHCEYSLHFIHHLDAYQDGLMQIWQELQEIFPNLKGICFESLLSFLLSSQLYKFPVSALISVDINRFRNLTQKRKRFYHHLFQICILVQHAITEFRVIDYINELYKERFRECNLKLSAKESILVQLRTKLIYAHDPMIRSEEELEKKYFSYLISHEIQKDSGNIRLKYSSLEDENTEGANSTGLKLYIRHLFRAISKNCREAFAISDDTGKTVDSTKFFMDSNAIYNEMNVNFNDQFIQFHQLINLFVQVYNTRITHELPATFFDYTGIDQDKMLFKQLDEEVVAKIKIHAGEKITERKEHCNTTFKGKHIVDEELAEIHEEYLKMQIQFLDQRIADILAEIKNIMKQKTIGSVVF